MTEKETPEASVLDAVRELTKEIAGLKKEIFKLMEKIELWKKSGKF